MKAAKELKDLAAKLDALGMWDVMSKYNWAVKPRGIAVPYFCVVVRVNKPETVKWRFAMFKGWQTFQDFIRFRVDESIGYYLTPMEMSHFELVVCTDGSAPRVFIHEPGYVPSEVVLEHDVTIAKKILWQMYGMMLRVESEPDFAFKYSQEKSVFTRVEVEDGQWIDAPLVIPEPVPIKEEVAFAKEMLDKAKDLPMKHESRLIADFDIVAGVMTNEARPRLVYKLTLTDEVTGARIEERTSLTPGTTLKDLWQQTPQRILFNITRNGFVPGELIVTSKRLFRLVRPLLLHLPIKLRLKVSEVSS
ncbi:MAG: hypothetical protein J6S51_04260 [Kiritimatiellae bacterium]|nr:hypothetical protein [Kiritimatiellia bacterium]